MISLRTIAACAFALAAAACGNSKPAEWQGPAKAQTGSTAPTATPNAMNNTPASKKDDGSSGSVAISDEIRKKCGIDDHDAFFPFNSSTLVSQDIKPLNQVATCFTSGPLKGRGVKLVGHADPRGPNDYNMTLGQSRADTVQRYLGNKGVKQAESSSRGAMDATGTDEPSWAKDRRVDVMLGN
jgi:peptidoglycan-associated lipoprotein